MTVRIEWILMARGIMMVPRFFIVMTHVAMMFQ